MRPFRFLLALAFAHGALCAQSSAPVLPAVASAMQAVVDAHEIAGAVTVVATKNKIVHLGTTGFSDIAEKKPMPADALFWIASCSKPTAAVAVLMLQDEGKLKLSDPVAKYIPGFASLKTPSGQLANLTIERLLTHTSGLAEVGQAGYAAAKGLAELMDGLTTAPMQFEPGARWKYTTSGFDVAGRIVEILSGKSYEAFLEERLFAPLGMKDTTFFPTDAQYARIASCYVRNRTTGALEKQPQRLGQPARGKFPPMPGGGLFSTASDLARFGQMLLNHGVLDGKRYLSETAFQTLVTIHTGDLTTGFSTAQINRVLGWGLGTYVLRTPHDGASAALSPGSFGHPGAYGTHLIVDPVKELVYVLMIQRPNLPDNFENEPTRALVQSAATALAKAP